jgi:two-component system cell cycle sensor histidine kinase/response regulator CckA
VKVPPNASDPHPAPGETILLVEDEEHVRKLLEDFLVLSGYTVLSAADASRALQILADLSHQIDLLLTDIVMPGMNGWELAERFADARPGAAILAMSGLSGSAIRKPTGARQNPELLQKPFSLKTLAAAVREALDSRKSK